MTVTLTLSFDSLTEMQGFLRGQQMPLPLPEPEPQPAVEQAEAEPAPAKRRGRPAKADVPGKEAPAPAPAPAPVKAADPITKDAALAKFKEVHDAKGLPVCMAILQRFGVRRFAEVKPDAYASFVVTCDEALAGKDIAAADLP